MDESFSKMTDICAEGWWREGRPTCRGGCTLRVTQERPKSCVVMATDSKESP